MWFRLINSNCYNGYLEPKYVELIERTGCYDLEYEKKQIGGQLYYDCKILIEDTYDLIELYKLVDEEIVITNDYEHEMCLEIYDYWRE